MSDIQYGWKCPGCSTVYAPWQGTCEKCSTVTRTVISGYSGTASLSFVGCGTAFYSPPKTVAVQAQEVVSDWRTRGFSAKALISAAVDTLIEEDDE